VIPIIVIAVVAVGMWAVYTGVVYLTTTSRGLGRLARSVKFLSSGEQEGIVVVEGHGGVIRCGEYGGRGLDVMKFRYPGYCFL
jgi:hypothetical protein